MFTGEIDLIEIEGDGALRTALESLDARVNRFPIGQQQHWLQVLQRSKLAPYLVVNAHGGERGFHVPELSPNLLQVQPFVGPIGPEEIRACGRVEGVVIVSLACMSGSPEMAAAWLEMGAATYIAPDGYPEAADALLFALVLFWQILIRHARLEEAFAAANAIGGDAELFRLYGITK